MTSKRILKQQYLETKIRAGVYAIRNWVTGRALVAGSTNVQGVLNRHHFELRHGTHPNPLLSQEWSLHGEASFSFEVLDVVKPREDFAFDVAGRDRFAAIEAVMSWDAFAGSVTEAQQLA